MTPEWVGWVREIEYQALHLANNLMVGAYRSAFRGQGMEFDQVRAYEPGDDVRDIDWKVSARRGHPHVKTFREERELSVHLLVDLSASTRYGSFWGMKSERIAQVAALLAFCALKNQDKVGLILFSDRVEKYLPLGKRRNHILHILRELLNLHPLGRGNGLEEALHFFGRLQMKSGICFLISDFLFPSLPKNLNSFARHHDLITMRIYDPLERALLPANLVSLEDPESGEKQVADFSDRSWVSAYQSAWDEQQRMIAGQIKQMGAGMIDLPMNEPYFPKIKKFFDLRKRWLHS